MALRGEFPILLTYTPTSDWWHYNPHVPPTMRANPQGVILPMSLLLQETLYEFQTVLALPSSLLIRIQEKLLHNIQISLNPPRGNRGRDNDSLVTGKGTYGILGIYVP